MVTLYSSSIEEGVGRGFIPTSGVSELARASLFALSAHFRFVSKESVGRARNLFKKKKKNRVKKNVSAACVGGGLVGVGELLQSDREDSHCVRCLTIGLPSLLHGRTPARGKAHLRELAHGQRGGVGGGAVPFIRRWRGQKRHRGRLLRAADARAGVGGQARRAPTPPHEGDGAGRAGKDGVRPGGGPAPAAHVAGRLRQMLP